MRFSAGRVEWTAHLPDGAPADIDLLCDVSLPGRWLRRWRERPSWAQVRAPDGRWMSSDELEERTRRAATRLLRSGLTPGDRLVLSAASSVELIVAYVAALRAGLVVVPLNTAYTETEVRGIVHEAGPSAAAVDDDERARWISDVRAIPVHGIDLALPNASDDTADVDRATTDDPALLLYTSGTTGRPKGALLNHGNLLAGATAVNIAWRWAHEDSLLLALPLFHLHGLGVGVNGALCAGASLRLRQTFDTGDIAAHAGQGSTMFFGVPAMYQRLAADGQLAALAPLRLLVSGSAPLPAALAHEVAATTGQIPLERYGMTETVMLTSNPYAGERRPGSVGLPLLGVEVRLADSAEVEVRGPNVIAGYDRNPDANAAAFTADGWFRTGDLGAFDDDGYLRLIGRSKELIISGGLNVYPREVEEVLLAHPAVVEVAVVGRPSERWGEEVTAVVVAQREVAVDELRALASGRLAPYKVPKRFEFTDALPRNALGKVIRSEL